jgi:HAD superfamily hydrolase (TIGR01548 family)
MPQLKHLLLDMDGVLADVSKSYRMSIIKTCLHFLPLTPNLVTPELVHDKKIEGSCNNDWILSLDLIIQARNSHPHLYPPNSLPPTLVEVTAKFEEIYQGTPSSPGLYMTETLIPSLQLIESLFEKTSGSVAIVTGRPKADCAKFLKQVSLTHFSARLDDNEHRS